MVTIKTDREYKEEGLEEDGTRKYTLRIANSRKSLKLKQKHQTNTVSAMNGYCAVSTLRGKEQKGCSEQVPSVMMWRTLVYHHALVKSLKQKFQCAAKEKTRNLIARIVSGKILKKYRFQKIIHDTLGVSAKRFCKNVNTNGDEIACFARKKYISTHLKLQDQVVAFYTRDDVSRSTAGKKQTVTKGKVKKQKRFMTDTMKNLHRKFLLENVSSKLSYTLFCRMRPYWVVHPTIADRDTCLCKVHENLEFIVEKLHDLKLLEKTELESLAEETCCNPTFKPCMYAECKNCKLQDLKIQSG